MSGQRIKDNDKSLVESSSLSKHGLQNRFRRLGYFIETRVKLRKTRVGAKRPLKAACDL